MAVKQAFLEDIYADQGGLDQWMRDCGFMSNDEAIAALEVSPRSWFRWKANGLPKGWMAGWILRRLVEIKKRRNKRKG